MVLNMKTKNKFHLKYCNFFEEQLIFNHLITHSHTLQVWEKGMDESDIEYFEIKEQCEAPKTFSIQKKGNFLKKAVKTKLKNSEIYFKFPLGQKTYCGKGSFKYVSGISYELQITGKILIFEKRKHYRLRAQNDISIRAKLGGKKYECYDLSAAAISIRVPAEDMSDFKIGEVIPNLKVAINDAVFKIPQFRVIAVREDTSRAKTGEIFYQTVCVFHKNPKTIEQELNKHINIYARKIELKY